MPLSDGDPADQHDVWTRVITIDYGMRRNFAQCSILGRMSSQSRAIRDPPAGAGTSHEASSKEKQFSLWLVWFRIGAVASGICRLWL